MKVEVAVGVFVGVEVEARGVKVEVTVGVAPLGWVHTPPPKVPTYIALFPKLTCWMELKGRVVTRAQVLPSSVVSKNPWFSVP